MNAFYTVIADPYCYPGTTVLKNKAGLRSQVELDAFESRMTALRAEEPLPLGRLSVRHYQAIHRHLFQDVYPWAGKLRTVRISKNQSMFCYPENIPSQLGMLFDRLSVRRAFRQQSIDQFSKSLGSFLSNLNAIHPSEKAMAVPSLRLQPWWRIAPAIRSISIDCSRKPSCRPWSRASSAMMRR